MASDLTALSATDERDQAGPAAVFTWLPDAVIVADHDGIVRDASAATETLLGWPRADLIGRAVTVLIPEQLVDAHRQGFGRWAATGEPRLFGQVLSVSARHRDGSDVAVELVLGALPGRRVIASVRPASAPAALETHATTRDLLSVLAQPGPFAELSQALLAALASGLGYDVAGLWLLTIEQRRMRCARVFNGRGKQAELFVAQSLATSIPKGVGVAGRIWADPHTVEIADLRLDDNFPRRSAADLAGLRSAVAFPVLSDGDLVGVIELFASQPNYDHGPAIAVMAEIGRNLGGFLQQRIDDEQRRIDAERLRLAIDSAGIGVWRWDKATGEVVWDEAMEALFGLGPGEFDGVYENYVARLHPDDRSTVLATVEAAVANQRMYQTVHRVVLTDQQAIRWLSSSGRPLRGDDGETIGLIGISADITQRKLAQDAADRLVALVESSTDAVIGATPGGVITSWNAGAHALLGYSADVIGRPLADIVPADRHAELHRTLDLVASGVSAPSADTAWITGTGASLDLAVVMSPVVDPQGMVTAVSVIARDNRAHKQRERHREQQAEQSRVLAHISDELAGAVTPDEVLDVLVDVGTRALDGDAAVVAVVMAGDAGIEILRHARAEGDRSDADRSMGSGSAAVPAADDRDTADLPAFGDAAEVGVVMDRAAAHPIAQAIRERCVVTGDVVGGHAGAAQVVAIPLIGEGAPIGALALRHREPIELDEARQRFLLDIANRAANAYQRARLFAAERAARDASERAAQRLAVLSRAGDVFATRNEVGQIGEALADLLTDAVADWCQVRIEGPDRERNVFDRLSPAGDQGSIAEMVSDLAERSRWVEPRHIDDVAEHGDDLPTMAALVAAGVQSLLVVPVVARDEALGAVVLGTLRPRRFDENDLALARELVRRCATAIDNARLVHHLRRLAASFQRNLLPRHLPSIDGLELGARYEAAGYGTDIGGDFYDVFALDDRRWVIVIGDVCGQGADAAGITALARHTLRAIIPLSDSLAAALGRVNRTLIDHDIDDRFITIALALVELTADGALVRLAQAGHPDPILLQADGSTEAMGASRGTLLGVREHPEFTETSLQLRPGDSLVFYTDGVTEISNGMEQFGEARLCQLLSAAPVSSAAWLAGRVLQGALDFHGDESTDDDMAVLTIRIPDGSRDRPA